MTNAPGRAVYTILNEPTTPWVNTAGNQRNAWKSALDFAVVTCNADGNATEDDAMEAVTTHLYTIPYTGASQYLTFGGNFSYMSAGTQNQPPAGTQNQPLAGT